MAFNKTNRFFIIQLASALQNIVYSTDFDHAKQIAKGQLQELSEAESMSDIHGDIRRNWRRAAQKGAK